MIVRCTTPALIIRTVPIAGAVTDTGRRMIANQHAHAYGHSLDERWIYVDAPAGPGWVSAQYVTESKADTLPSPPWPRVPNGPKEIREVFGSPGSPLCMAGRVVLPAPLRLSWKPEEAVRFVSCHKLVEAVFQSVFDQIYARKYWELLEDYGGIYNFRPIKGSAKLSTHSWGIAVDLNTVANPLGAKPVMDPHIIAVFADHGFHWGGNWRRRRDGAHFQYATGY